MEKITDSTRKAHDKKWGTYFAVTAIVGFIVVVVSVVGDAFNFIGSGEAYFKGNSGVDLIGFVAAFAFPLLIVGAFVRNRSK